MKGHLYTTDLDDIDTENLDAPAGHSWEEDPEWFHPYGSEDQHVLEGDRLCLYVMPNHQRGLGVQVNGEVDEVSTADIVCSYLDGEGLADLPGGDPALAEELGEEDRDILHFGADLAASSATYYQELAELCYRNR